MLAPSEMTMSIGFVVLVIAFSFGAGGIVALAFFGDKIAALKDDPRDE